MLIMTGVSSMGDDSLGGLILVDQGGGGSIWF